MKNVNQGTRFSQEKTTRDPAVDGFLKSFTYRRILRIEEENVDGCGTSAVMYVMFGGVVDDDIRERFQNILRGVKARTASEDYDTVSMVAEAVEEFNLSVFARNRGITVGIVDAPYCGVITF